MATVSARATCIPSQDTTDKEWKNQHTPSAEQPLKGKLITCEQDHQQAYKKRDAGIICYRHEEGSITRHQHHVTLAPRSETPPNNTVPRGNNVSALVSNRPNQRFCFQLPTSVAGGNPIQFLSAYFQSVSLHCLFPQPPRPASPLLLHQLSACPSSGHQS
ncbi:hypothetical protein VTI74DRAFT_521 [Chaetomium olivicolor]